MNRFLKALAAFSLVEAIGRHPAIAAGVLTLLGVGGGAVGVAMLTTPTILPFISANFNPNALSGDTNNGLKPNGGAAGAWAMPLGNTSGFTGSFAMYGEATINPNLGNGNGGRENLFAGLTLLSNSSPGQPTFLFQRLFNGGFPASDWWQQPFALGANQVGATAGSNYATGLYPWTASGGGCARPPTGVWQGASMDIVDPGFGCASAPTFNSATVANAGAAQTGITATCASGGLGMLVTTSVPVSPGLSPGLTYPLSGFTTSGGTSINATLTATSVTGTGPYTVVGTVGGSCPTISSAGTFGAGSGGAFNFPTFSPTNPLALGGTGITVKNGQHICFMIGENGDDSGFPGSQFLSMVDEKGNPLPGSPALIQTPNMGTANFTGWTTIGSATMNVSGMVPYTITSAAWSNGVAGLPAALGVVTFQVSSNPGYIQGSQFIVSGMSPSSVNGTYAAMAGSNSTQVIGSQLTGPGGVPQAYANPGAITTASTPQMISVIFPGMQVLGATGSAYVLPYGTASSTGTGSNGSVGTPATYQLSASQTAALGGGASPGSTLFAWSSFYYNAATGGTGPGGSTLTVRAAGSGGDFTNVIGSNMTTLGSASGWGGALGNVAFLAGVMPSQAGGAPSTSDLASICTKATDVHAYAKAQTLAGRPLKVQSLYRLNDLGIFGDSGYGTITGYLSGASGTSGGTATLNVVGPPIFGSLALTSGTATAKLTGVGLPVASTTVTTTTAATITLTTSASSTYTVTFPSGVTSTNLGSLGSPVTLAAGAFLPALPLQASTFKGYIDTTAGVSTLHVTSLDDGVSHSGFASFTGRLGTSFTARIDDGGTANVNPGNTLTVTAPVGVVPANAYIGKGTQVCPAVGSSAFTCATVTGLVSGVGYNGTYTIDGSAQNITVQPMYGSGALPGPAQSLQATGITGTLQAGMAVTDGGASLTGSPLLITGGGGSLWSVAGNYYAPISADTTMQASLTTIVPGEYIQNALITNPVKVVAYGAGAIGLAPGSYVLSGNPNASGAVGSNPAVGGTAVVFTGTTITDGGAIAPGPALLIKDQGPFITFPLTNIPAKTGAITVSGTYDVATLGGMPTGIQALVSSTANGPPLAGCTPCNWGALTGTISGGKWSGTIGPIPAGGPYSVSVRAANGIGYATMPNSVKVGWVFALWGQGQADSIQANQSGYYTSYFNAGLWGYGRIGDGLLADKYLYGPPVSGTFVPGQIAAWAGDRFGVGIVPSVPLSEAFLAFDQGLSNAFGVPTTFLSATRDGLGVGLQALGNVTQTQTIGAGDGSTLTWCSASAFCGNVDVGRPLLFNAATFTGAWFTGATITNPSGVPTFSAGTRAGGALEPGMVLNTPNAPTLVRCLTNCLGNVGASQPINFSTSTWLLSNSLDTGATPTRADPPTSLLPAGTTATPWPNLNIQLAGTQVYAFGGFGFSLIKAGTFKISVNGAVVCQDSQTFAYNSTGGNCTGATIASSFVNYQTGDYQVSFTSGNAPSSGASVIATWTGIISPDGGGLALSRPQGIDFFGDTTGSQSGADAALFAKTPGGINGHIYPGIGTDNQYIVNSGGSSNVGYQWGSIGYSQMVSWLFSTKFPNMIPGAIPGVSFISTGIWRSDGPVLFSTHLFDVIFEQWAQDASTRSTFSGTVTGSVLALTTSAAGPMWEGEVLGCVTYNATTCPIGPLSGAYITGLASGAWGASGSTYNLSVAPGNLTNQPIQNPVLYSGSGPEFYAGTLNDVIVQSQGLSGTIGRNPHTAAGFTGGRRATSRWAAMINCHNSGACDDPKLSRANDPTAGTPSPAFDTTNTFAAVHAATWSGNIVTISGGLAAHARPFVVGQAFGCAGCNSGLVITSLSVPPTESTAAGAGEVGQTFTFTANNAAGQAIGGSGSGTATAGCTTGSGGSNCINVDIALNGASAIDTCGANNINGNAPNYVVPNGKCQGNGIGEIVRTFRVGTQQAMYGSAAAGPQPGSVFDDGVDPANGAFNQSAAFTANIVGATTIQFVKAPAYSGGALTGVGKWSSGSTYVSYGDMDLASGRLASLVGYVGGQSFPFTAGSGYTNGTTTVAATCTTIQSPGTAPRFDVTVAGGAIVNVVPSAATSGNVPTGFGIGTTCTVPLPSGGTGGAIPTIQLAPIEGVGGIATYNTEANTMGMYLYDNSGEPGNPLNPFFTNGTGGYFEPGLPLRPFGIFQGAGVSG